MMVSKGIKASLMRLLDSSTRCMRDYTICRLLAGCTTGVGNANFLLKGNLHLTTNTLSRTTIIRLYTMHHTMSGCIVCIDVVWVVVETAVLLSSNINGDGQSCRVCTSGERKGACCVLDA
jgi:hypothetical protein